MVARPGSRISFRVDELCPLGQLRHLSGPHVRREKQTWLLSTASTSQVMHVLTAASSGRVHRRGARQDTGAYCHRESGGLNTGNVSMHVDKIKRRQSTWELAQWQLFPPPGLKGRRTSSYHTRWDLCPWEKDQPMECKLPQRYVPSNHGWQGASEGTNTHPPCSCSPSEVRDRGPR